MENQISIDTELMVSDLVTEEMEHKYLSFCLQEQFYGIPISDVVQIISIQKITEIPNFPDYAKGIINLRGTILPIIDLKMRLGKNETEYTDHTCIIVTFIRKKLYGFIVDSVDEVVDIAEEDISEPPQATENGISGSFLKGIAKYEDRMTLLMDMKKIINDDQFKN